MDIYENDFKLLNHSNFKIAFKSTKPAESSLDYIQESTIAISCKALAEQDVHRDYKEDSIEKELVTPQANGLFSLKAHAEITNRINRFKSTLTKDDLIAPVQLDDELLDLPSMAA